MAKAARTTCDRCESRIAVGAPFCGSCGYPTTWASHDERTAWEVAQYREKSATAPISKIAEDAPRKRAASRVDVMDRPAVKRERKTLGSLFGRRRPQTTTITLPEPKRVEPPADASKPSAPVLTMVRMAAEGVDPTPMAAAAAPAIAPKPALAPKPAVAPKPVAQRPAPRVRAPKVERPMAAAAAAPKADGLVSKVERAMNDNELVVDTPATVLAMRLLNQRVRELDEKVQRLERELTAAKAPPASEPEQPHKRFGR